MCSERFYGKQQFLLCSGTCNRRFHCKCIAVGKDEYELLMQNGKRAYKCSRHRGSSSDERLDNDSHDAVDILRLRTSTENAASGVDATGLNWLCPSSECYGHTVAEVKSLKAENNFMRSEISLLNKRILKVPRFSTFLKVSLPLATRPRGRYAAAAASFASALGKHPRRPCQESSHWRLERWADTLRSRMQP